MLPYVTQNRWKSSTVEDANCKPAPSKFAKSIKSLYDQLKVHAEQKAEAIRLI